MVLFPAKVALLAAELGGPRDLLQPLEQSLLVIQHL